MSIDIEDHAQLAGYLRRSGVLAADQAIEAATLAGGVSNRTVLVGLPGGERWVLKQALAKLRVAADWFSDPARIGREALGLRWMAELAPPGTAPQLVFEDAERQIIAMQAVAEPHENWKSMLLRGELRDGHVDQFATLLGTFHRRAASRAAELAPIFADQLFFETLRLDPYYRSSAAAVPAAAPFIGALIAETQAQRHTLVHGDYSPKNVLVHADRLVLLDYEVIHWGDPAFDLGFALTHLLSKAHHLPALRRPFAAAARRFWRTYMALARDGFGALEPRAARHTLACLLARVDGRSPLEYLHATERARQRAVVLTLIDNPPSHIPLLIDRFVELLDVHD